jgi:hypothetical protein
MNELETDLTPRVSVRFGHDFGRRHLAPSFPGMDRECFQFSTESHLENLALRQQLLALHAKRPRRRLTTLQKLFWVV